MKTCWTTTMSNKGTVAGKGGLTIHISKAGGSLQIRGHLWDLGHNTWRWQHTSDSHALMRWYYKYCIILYIHIYIYKYTFDMFLYTETRKVCSAACPKCSESCPWSQSWQCWQLNRGNLGSVEAPVMQWPNTICGCWMMLDDVGPMAMNTLPLPPWVHINCQLDQFGAGWCWMMVDGAGWCWMVLDDVGWCWMVLDGVGVGWCWMMLDGVGWCWMVLDDVGWC